MRNKYSKVWLNPETRDAIKMKAIRCKKPVARLSPRDLGLEDFPKNIMPKPKQKRFKFKL